MIDELTDEELEAKAAAAKQEYLDELPETHDLTYNGRVEVEEGRLMGKGLDGKIWEIQGGMYDPETDKTTVTVDEFVPNY